METNFEEYFINCLGDRTDVIDHITNFLSNKETDLFDFFISEYTSFGDDDEEEYGMSELDEYCGLQIFIKGKSSHIDYKYYLLDISLSSKLESLLISVQFNSFSSKKTVVLSDLKTLDAHLNMIFNSREYTTIINKLNSVLYP